VKRLPAPEQLQELALKRLGERLLEDWAESSESRLASAPSLGIFSPAAPSPDLQSLVQSRGAPALRLAFADGADLEWGGIPIARTSSRALPLQTAMFGAVMLCHVLARGDEPELAEACRLLQPGGRLFIVGLNRSGLRYWRTRLSVGLPGMSLLALRARLEALDMQVLRLHAAGFLQSERPRHMNRGAARLLVPFADMCMIVAKPVEPKIMNPLAKSELRTVGAPSAWAGR